MGADGTLKFDTSLDSGGFQSGMGKVAGIAQQALGVFSGQLMTRAVDSLVNLGKTALQSVGSLEQNVGGVETLFGDAADAVIAAADRAYQTAGMSANEYMSTVTSFSASLLQSLGGNTEEAAKVADMAIIDMADNANKMGTSMDAIQNAYQGFAKQNYTMLDNLKLGYGGTKSEMERLLHDAQELTGVKYDINNLNDVYQAIHAVQEEMGITGTTAKEASETLEGSMAAAKAAWDNFMNGSGSADQLADAFAVAAENIVDNLAEIIPRLAETLPALAVAIVAQIPGLVAAIVPAVVNTTKSIVAKAKQAVLNFDFVSAAQTLVQKVDEFMRGDGLGTFLGSLTAIFTGLVNGINSMLPTLLPALVGLIAYVTQTLINQLPALLTCALQLIQGLADGLLAALPVLISALPQIITSIVAFLIDSTPQILEAGIQLLMSLVDAIPTIIDACVAALPEIITSIVTTVTEGAPEILSAGIQLLMSLVDAIPTVVLNLVNAMPDIIVAIINGLIGALPQVFTAAKDLWGQITEAVPELLSKIANTVPYVIDGIVNGLADGASRVWEAACNLGRNILDGIKDFLGIHSPSTVMEDQGGFVVAGLMNGLAAMPGEVASIFAGVLDSVCSWGANMATQAQQALSNMVSGAITVLQELPGKVWEHLTNTVANVVQWGQQLASNASTAASKMLSGVVGVVQKIPEKMWTYLSSAAQKVISFGTDLAKNGADAATKLFDSIVDGLVALPEKMSEIGSHIITGIWNGISSGWDWLKNKVSGLADSLLGVAKDVLRIGSPSKAFRDEVGRWIMPGVGIGVEKSMPKAIKEMQAHAGQLVSTMQAEMSAGIGKMTVGVSHSAGLKSAGGGTTVYNDNHMEQQNTYNTPVASPAEVAKTQRQALRNMIGGVK